MARLSSLAVNLSVRTSVVGGTDVVTVAGELDLATLPDLHHALVRHIQTHRGETVVVDLDAVTFCDDAGLGVLLGAAGRAREADGDLAVVSSPGPLRQRLARTGFDRAVSVFDSIASMNDG